MLFDNLKTTPERRFEGVLAVVVVCALSLAPAPCQAAAPAKPAKTKYTPMQPFEDLTHQEEAQKLFDQALKDYQAGSYDQAEKLFKRVIALDAKNADALFNLGAIAEWRADLGGALKYYRAASALKPQDTELKSAIVDVESKLRDRTTAKAKEDENKRDLDLASAGQTAKEAFASGDYHESAKQLYALSRTFPKEAKIQYALGQSLRALKKYSWSAYHLKLAIYNDPENDVYRKALVDLDDEVLRAQDKALLDSASVALLHVRPFVGGEVADTGL